MHYLLRTTEGLKFVNFRPLESTYINRKRRTKLRVVGVGEGLADRYISRTKLWPSRDAAHGQSIHIEFDYHLFFRSNLSKEGACD